MIAGRYTLEREIGRGGAGSVHLAHDDLLGRSVAIKRIGLLPGTTGQDIARAEREARLAAGINHPHVVSIYDLVKDDDCYWLVMELVDGRTLTELVAAEGPLPPRRAAGLVAQAADALLQANKAGIVHRRQGPATSWSTTTTTRSWATSASPAPRRRRPDPDRHRHRLTRLPRSGGRVGLARQRGE